MWRINRLVCIHNTYYVHLLSVDLAQKHHNPRFLNQYITNRTRYVKLYMHCHLIKKQLKIIFKK